MAFSECFSHTSQKRSMPFWLGKSLLKTLFWIANEIMADTTKLLWTLKTTLKK